MEFFNEDFAKKLLDQGRNVLSGVASSAGSFVNEKVGAALSQPRTSNLTADQIAAGQRGEAPGVMTGSVAGIPMQQVLMLGVGAAVLYFVLKRK